MSPVPHVFVIAELGINHNGSRELAERMIRMAHACGVDAVKFQKRTVDVVYTAAQLDQPRLSPWGTTQREQKLGLELSAADYDALDALCAELGLPWFASAWDIASQRFLRKYGCKYNKIASPMLTHLDLLKDVAWEQKPTFVSTGMSTWEEIDAAVAIFRTAGCPFTLMHCVSEYPARDEDLNLKMIQELGFRYGCDVGYSAHQTSIIPSLYAAAWGAVAIEHHITLDRAMYGSDQAASLEADDLRLLVSRLRTMEAVYGDGVKRITDGERRAADKLRPTIWPSWGRAA